MIALGVRGLPRGEYDRFLIATPPFGVGGSARLPLGESDDLPPGGGDSPWGEYIDLPRGGRAPTVGVTFSPVGKGLPLGGRDGPPRRGEDSPWV